MQCGHSVVEVPSISVFDPGDGSDAECHQPIGGDDWLKVLSAVF